MSDIVTRLRENAEATNRLYGGLELEAANEIVELRRKAERLQKALNEVSTPEGQRISEVADWLRSKGYQA